MLAVVTCVGGFFVGLSTSEGIINGLNTWLVFVFVIFWMWWLNRRAERHSRIMWLRARQLSATVQREQDRADAMRHRLAHGRAALVEHRTRLEAIQNERAKTELLSVQANATTAVLAYADGDPAAPLAAAQSILEDDFLAARKIADAELARLQRLIDEHSDAYSLLGDRWLVLKEITMGLVEQLRLAPQCRVGHVPHWFAGDEDALAQGTLLDPTRSCLEDHVALLQLRAAWVKPIFEAKLRRLADAVNAATKPSDLGLEDHPSFLFDFDVDTFVINDVETGRGSMVLRVGPNKTEMSALRKVNTEYRTDPAAYPVAPRSKYLLDMV